MNTLAKSFFKGLLIVVPLIATIYVVYLVVTLVDGLLGVPVPGLGLALTVVSITVVGLLASNVVGRRSLEALEKGIDKLPVVKLLYQSVKDLMGAFVGDKKSFDKPVMVEVFPGQGIKMLGFVTCTRFDDPKLQGHVAVYLPQSYNFAGNLLVVPQDRVEKIDADGAQFMAFIVSGGVATMSGAETMYDADAVEKMRAGLRQP
ncbi:MAG: hypothetical protein DRJ42_23670 [Deltaproteobacteria bacterium]|nr:MAG: hypothetical protein DRJ42_23670 [Deltaproteobacteria bacterium]